MTSTTQTPKLVAEFEQHLAQVHQKIQAASTQESAENLNVSSLSGLLSRAVFYSHWHSADNDLSEKISQSITKATQHIEHHPVPTEFVNGLAGFGWGISHVAQKGCFHEDENKFLAELDEFLFQQAQQTIAEGNYDFFYGGIGYGKYFLQRRNAQPGMDEYLTQITKEIKAIAKPRNGLRIWQTAEDVKENEIDLSLSHGMSSMIAFMTKLLETGIETDFISETLLQSSEFLLTKRAHLNGGVRLPDFVKGDEATIAPLRWCHGDLGVAYALCCAGKALGEPRFIQAAEEVIDTVATLKDIKEQHIYSATLCHGTLGVAHMLSRFNQFFEPSSTLQEAIDYWYSQSNDLMNSKTGYCYYDDDQENREKTGIIYGLEGIGLALLSALGKSDSSWDSCIHLS